MKKLFALILFFITTLVYGQEMSVKSFYLAENDLTANIPGTMVHDQNGNVCALIKVETPLDGFSFDVGVLGVSEVKREGGEIWVYVPYGIRRITLSHPQFGVVRDFQIPCAIESGRTYIMKIVAGTVRTIVEHTASKQFLFVELTPKDAILEINGKIKATDNGVYQELLPFGKYQYKVYSQNYHDLVGVIEVSDPTNTHSISLTLNPAFGHISILPTDKKESTGAAVYIDDKFVGQIPVNNFQVKSGTHSIRVIKGMYEAYNESFTISDGEHKQLTPSLVPDFAELTIVTADEASIYINGELKGTHEWSGHLATGSYIFESRQKGHISYKQTYDISRREQDKRIEIPGPTPIYGSLVISSIPSKAKIYIDGKYIGETPKYISNHVIGEYDITIMTDGYESQTKRANIIEGGEASLQFKLEEQTEEIEYFSDLDTEGDEAIPFQLVEEKPSFQGGDATVFTKWVNQRLIYPEIAKNKGVQGRVTLKFIVDRQGKVTDVSVLHSVDPSLDKEAVRVVSMSPNWTPGRNKGKAVSVMYVYPVIFNLQYGSWR